MPVYVYVCVCVCVQHFVPLYEPFESFYHHNAYRRIRDCWNRPVASSAGSELELVERVSNDYNWSFKMTSGRQRVINMGSYNYLGFCSPVGPCSDAVEECLRRDAVGVCSSRQTLGTPAVVRQLERKVLSNTHPSPHPTPHPQAICHSYFSNCYSPLCIFYPPISVHP